MAISSFSNPIPDLVQGLLQGHALGLQMHNQKQADLKFKTDQILNQQKIDANTIMQQMTDASNRQALGQMGRSVSPMGTVTSPGVASMSTGVPIPGLDTQAGAPSYTRKADASRTVTYGGQKTELYTPEEQDQQGLTRQINTGNALADAQQRHQAEAMASARRNQLTLEGGGTAAPAGLEALGVMPGTKLTRSELVAAQEQNQKIQAGYRVKLGEGDTLIDTSPQPDAAAAPGAPAVQQGTQDGAAMAALGAPAPYSPLPANLQGRPTAAAPAAVPGAAPVQAALPGQALPNNPTVNKMRVIAQGGEKQPTGEFGAYLKARVMKAGYTMQNAPPDVVIEATNAYAQKAKNPDDVAQIQAMRGLQLQLAQAHIDDLRGRMADRAKQGSTAIADYQPGSREYKVAQDLAYGKLTMQQFRSLTAYSRDTNKKMDIYQKASELNPNFNPAQFEMGFKFAANPKTQQQLASMDNVDKGVNDLLKFSDAASRSGAPIVNKFIQKGGIAVGGKTYSDFHTAQIAFADELSGALGFGGATDMSKKMGVDMTNPNLSPEQFRSTIQNVVVPFVARKKKSLLDQMGAYGQPGMNPAAGPSGAAAPANRPPLSSFEK